MTIVKNAKKRGRPPAFDRNSALERAMTAFWMHGYDHASMPVLTTAMGISAQSLYATFESKEKLYREAIDLYRTTIGGFAARALEEEADAIDALERVLLDAADTFARTAGAPGCMITTAPAGVEDEPMTVFGRALRAESIAAVAKRIKKGQREGHVRLDADSTTWASFISGIVQGMSVQARDGATRASLRRMARLAIDSLQQLRPGSQGIPEHAE